MADLQCSIGDETGLCQLGDHIAKNEGYPGLGGQDAIFRYIIDKYGWTPEQVRSLSNEDMRILLDGYHEVVIVP
jgi:hypothetical protein